MNEKKESEEEKNRFTRRQKVVRSVIFVFLLVFLAYLTFSLVQAGINPIIIFLIVSFLFLVFLGFILRKKKTGLISKLFPSMSKEVVLFKGEKDSSGDKKPPEYDLKVKYRSPLIQNCSECGMILTRNMKKCPNCGKKLKGT